MTHAASHTHAGFAHPHKNVAALGITEGMRVADFGAGSGAYSLACAAALADTGRVYAIDVQKDLLRRLANEAQRAGFKNVDVLWADLETPRASKLADHSIDLVLLSNILFQVHHVDIVIAEAKRVVKYGGRIAIIDWLDSFGGMGPAKDHVFKKDTALEAAEKEGLALISEFSAGAHHYGLLFKKPHV